MFDSDSEYPQSNAARILGLGDSATLQDAADAYRKLASKYHPDRVLHSSDEQKAVARQKMAEINEAYEYLKPVLPALCDEADGCDSKPDSKPSNRSTNSAESMSRAKSHSQTDSSDQEPKVDRLIEFTCPTCKSRIRVPESVRGKEGQCTRCRQMITVPTHIELRCVRCSKKNRVPNVLKRQRAICRNCFGSLADAQIL